MGAVECNEFEAQAQEFGEFHDDKTTGFGAARNPVVQDGEVRNPFADSSEIVRRSWLSLQPRSQIQSTLLAAERLSSSPKTPVAAPATNWKKRTRSVRPLPTSAGQSERAGER